VTTRKKKKKEHPICRTRRQGSRGCIATAVRRLTGRIMCTCTIRQYGSDAKNQFVKLWIPDAHDETSDRCFPVVVIVHGGFWKSIYTVDNARQETIAPFMCSQGFIVLDIEYRRSDDDGGGYPGTNQDVLEAVNLVRQLGNEGVRVDEKRVVLVGHSAGGTLVLWYAAQAVASSKLLSPALIVSVAPIADLPEAHRRKLSDDGTAVCRYMKGVPEGETGHRYQEASPYGLLPCKIPLLLVAGTRDTIVPLDMIYRYFVKASNPGGNDGNFHELLVLAADHFDLVHAHHDSWRRVYSCILMRLGLIPEEAGVLR